MVEVFGVPMVATPKWNTTMLNHVASVLAGLLDQDNDGCVDDPKAHKELLRKVTEKEGGNYGFRSGIVLTNTPQDEDYTETTDKLKLDIKILLGLTQVVPACSGLKFTQECCDASIEELFHFVTTPGHAKAYPTIFGMGFDKRSTLTNAMDLAR